MNKPRSDAEDIIQAIPSGLYIYRYEAPDRLFLISGNPEAERLTGLKAEDWIGREFREIWPQADAFGVTQRYLEVARTGRVFETEDLFYEDQRLSGAFRIRVFPLPESRLGVAFEDISDKKRAEEELKRSQELLALYIAHSPVYTFIKRCTPTESRVLHASENYQDMVGIPGSALVGKSMQELFPAEFAEKITADDWAVVSRGEVLKLDEELGGRYYTTIKFPITHGGQTLLAGYTIDITDRKQAEVQRLKLEAQLHQAMKMEAVGRLAGGVAHDFNNLLTGIVGNAELALLMHRPEEPLAELLREILKAADSATSLTRQLLAFSRKQPIAPRVVNLNDLVVSLHKMLTRVIGEDIELVIATEPRLGPATVDPSQFEQILLNLAVNARDAMPSGGRLTIATANATLDEAYCQQHQDARPGPHVVLSVTDTGHGMSEEVKARLFEPFFTTKGLGKGTGLGLATTYGAVTQLGGHLEVLSQEGLGSTFRVYLPQAQGVPLSEPQPPTALGLPRGTETILLAEDEDSVRELAARTLRSLGYTVLAAPNGSTALGQAATFQGKIDLLLTDVVMPGMNGLELARQLERHRPGIRVLFTSGYAEDHLGHHGGLGPGVSFLPKPYSPQLLAAKVREVLNR